MFLVQSLLDEFNKPRSGSRTINATNDFSKAFDSVWHPALFHKLISSVLLSCFARWSQSFFSNGRACVNHKSRSFESVEVFRKDPFLALYFSLSSPMISLLLCLLPSDAHFMMTIWPFGTPPPWFLLRWRPHKQICFDWSASMSTGVFLSIRANVRTSCSQ